MGFIPEETHYKLSFEDPKLAGLVVVVSEVTTGDLLGLIRLAKTLQNSGDDVAGLADKIRELFGVLAGSLVEWNVEYRNGDPRPANLKGVESLGLKLVLQIVMAWISAMAEVDIPLPTASNSGESAQVLSLPTATLSPSPGS